LYQADATFGFFPAKLSNNPAAAEHLGGTSANSFCALSTADW
jgi:hypothetical protein